MNDKPLNILLIEDDDVDVMNVRRAFKKNDVSNPLFIARNGLEALAMLRGDSDHPPQIPDERRLILLDLNMPKMGGIEFLQELRSDPKLKTTPVVVLTTSDQEQDRLHAYEFNVAGYLLKPVAFIAFTKIIEVLSHYWALCEMP